MGEYHFFVFAMPLPGKDYSSATYGFEFICFLLENPIHTVTLPIPIVLACLYLSSSSILWLPVWYCATLAIPAVAFCLALVVNSWNHDGGAADWSEFLVIHDKDMDKAYAGKKIPIFTVVESYMAGKVDFKKDFLETLMHRNELFRFTFTPDLIRWFLKDFVMQMTGHTPERDHHEVGDVYNRGNDFYSFFLGEMMIYTSGIYTSLDDSLEDAQRRKLDTIAKYIHLKAGEEHLDIGCGWGTLISYFAKNYGSNSTGCTLAKEQVEWGKKTAAKYGVTDKVSFLCCDYRLIPEKTNDKKYNKITCLEMAEHVGIKNFAIFLRQVYDMLEDDGMFYLQIAGLRRTWQWEDLVWGCFMGKYIFPAPMHPAPSASLPASWSEPASRSTASKTAACTTRAPSNSGTTTGRPTRARSTRRTASSGTACGFSSSRGPR